MSLRPRPPAHEALRHGTAVTLGGSAVSDSIPSSSGEGTKSDGEPAEQTRLTTAAFGTGAGVLAGAAISSGAAATSAVVAGPTGAKVGLAAGWVKAAVTVASVVSVGGATIGLGLAGSASSEAAEVGGTVVATVLDVPSPTRGSSEESIATGRPVAANDPSDRVDDDQPDGDGRPDSIPSTSLEAIPSTLGSATTVRAPGPPLTTTKKTPGPPLTTTKKTPTSASTSTSSTGATTSTSESATTTQATASSSTTSTTESTTTTKKPIPSTVPRTGPRR